MALIACFQDVLLGRVFLLVSQHLLGRDFISSVDDLLLFINGYPADFLAGGEDFLTNIDEDIILYGAEAMFGDGDIIFKGGDGDLIITLRSNGSVFPGLLDSVVSKILLEIPSRISDVLSLECIRYGAEGIDGFLTGMKNSDVSSH